MVILPDVHIANGSTGCSAEDFASMAGWIVTNKDALNIQLVASVGDLTGRPGCDHAGVRTALQPIVNAGIPITLAIGNHDLDVENNGRACTAWNAAGALGADLYTGASWYGSTFETDAGGGAGVDPGGTINQYILLTMGGENYLILTLELGPRDKVMTWANDLVLNQYPERRLLVFTHAHLRTTGERMDVGYVHNPQNYTGFSTDPGDEYTNNGADLWTRWFQYWPNLVAVYCGHDGITPPQSANTGDLDSGSTAQEIFVNYQDWGYTENTLTALEATERATLLRLVRLYHAGGLAIQSNYLVISDVRFNAVPSLYYI